LGYGDLGCYGQTKIQTPNIDKLAAEGLKFTSFYAGSPNGLASRCSFLTGLNTGHSAIRESPGAFLGPQDMTIARMLKDAGYHTGLIGEWGLGFENPAVPSKQGFDEFVGYLTDQQAQDYYAERLARFDPQNHYDGDVVFPENSDGKIGLYIPDILSKASQNFVRLNKPDQFNHYRSFFLMLAYSIPRSDSEQAKRTGNGMVVPSSAPYSDQPWPAPEKNKAAMITRMDADIGKLMDELKKFKLDQDTIVIFTSNNGPHKDGGVDPKFFQSSGPLRGIKGDLYEGGIRVPMLVHWPAKVKPGVVESPWAAWDFLPTSAEIAWTKSPANIDGISFLLTLLGKAQTNQHACFYWESRDHGLQQAARMGDYKAIRLEPGKPLELYNLKTDLEEKHDVARDNPKLVAEMEKCLKSSATNSLPSSAIPSTHDAP
jgi:arylsulfatase A-like enzyme